MNPETYPEYSELQKKWAAIYDAMLVHAHSYSESVYRAIVDSAVKRMRLNASSCARLRDYDEQIYVHLARLMTAYRETAALFDRAGAAITTPKVKGIMDGIITVVISRLREFEEITAESGNPITKEKNAIIDAYTEEFSGGCKKLWEDFLSARLPAVVAGWLESGKLNEVLITDFNTKLERFYGLYKDNLVRCSAALNDFDRRRVAQHYLSQMAGELEILASIIKIQVQPLESAIKSALPKEQRVVQHILTVLREAYQHFGRSSKAINAAFGRLETTSPEEYPAFAEFLAMRLPPAEESRAAEELFRRASEFKLELLQDAAEQNGQAAIEYEREYKRMFAKSVYILQRLLNDQVMLAGDLTLTFIEMKEKWPAAPEHEKNTENYKIMAGIAETLQIKIEGLQETAHNFAEGGRKIIKNFQAEKLTVKPRDISPEEVWANWLAGGTAADDTLIGLKSHHEKTHTKYHELLSRHIFKFLRETLLYEVSTYEEILFYSVSRLRGSAHKTDVSQTAVLLADETLKQLDKLLKKNNILPLRPVPGEPFNPKEHEVLMAESKQGFKKGEIIKLMNSGYRQGKLVILRANVIAAR